MIIKLDDLYKWHQEAVKDIYPEGSIENSFGLSDRQKIIYRYILDKINHKLLYEFFKETQKETFGTELSDEKILDISTLKI